MPSNGFMHLTELNFYYLMLISCSYVFTYTFISLYRLFVYLSLSSCNIVMFSFVCYVSQKWVENFGVSIVENIKLRVKLREKPSQLCGRFNWKIKQKRWREREREKQTRNSSKWRVLEWILLFCHPFHFSHCANIPDQEQWIEGHVEQCERWIYRKHWNGTFRAST